MEELMEQKNKYEEMYEKLVFYEQKIHETNQKRIRIGLKCIWIIPLMGQRGFRAQSTPRV